MTMKYMIDDFIKKHKENCDAGNENDKGDKIQFVNFGRTYIISIYKTNHIMLKKHIEHYKYKYYTFLN